MKKEFDPQRVKENKVEAIVAVTKLRKRLQGNLPDLFDDLLTYAPSLAWFENQNGAHGINHAARSVLLGQLTARLIGSEDYPINTDEVSQSLSWHDMKRSETLEDKLHGKRAADWIREQFSEDPQSVFLQNSVNILRNLEYHDYPRGEIPEKAWTNELAVVRFADALDRVRFDDSSIDEKYKIDPNRLHFGEIGTILIPIARELYKRTTNKRESFTTVGKEAVDMGILQVRKRAILPKQDE